MLSTSHNNNNTSIVLADLLTCSKCRERFSADSYRPVNLSCGHAVCLPCMTDVNDVVCAVDQTKFSADDVKNLPLNMAILRLLDAPIDDGSYAVRSLPAYAEATGQSAVSSAAVECATMRLADHLRSGDGGAGTETLSRALQRKLATVLCAQPATPAGAAHMFRALRAVVERMLTELILALQNSSNISSHLWSAVRARGCQFLGPTMQEDVLRLMLSALSKGELIARKSLVMYIVRSLTSIYPQVSKTCVGHVVQLAYRASCFNVIKRDSESSLMQLKPEFRDYPRLRHEHDAQIVHIAVEAGLRISPEQWSSLLYGDLRHRSHMQTIVDRISAPQLLANAASELRNLLAGCKSSTAGACAPEDGVAAGGDAATDGHNASEVQTGGSSSYNNETLSPIFDHLKTLEMDEENLKVDVKLLWTVLCDVHAILEIFVGFMKNRPMNRTFDKRPTRKSMDHRPTNLYKTRMCRDVLTSKYCPNGDSCKYAHSFGELRTDVVNNNNSSNVGYGLNTTVSFMAGCPPPLPSAFGVGSPTTTHCVQRLNAVPTADIYATTGADGVGTVVVTNQIDAQPLAVQMAAPAGAPPPATILTNILDGTVTTLTPLMTASDAILPPPIVGAIDTTTGELVNLIPVHNIANPQLMTAIETDEIMPTNLMMEPIPLMPLLVQPQPPPPIGLDQQLAPSQPPLATQNIMMPTQPIPVVPMAAAGGTALFSIPVGAMSPPNAAGFMMNAAMGGHPPTNAPVVGIIPGLIIGSPPNFWTNDSCANDGGDEPFFPKLSTTIQKPTNAIGNSTRNLNTNDYNSARRPATNASGDGKGDEGQLLMRRNEIISQLADIRPSANILEEFYDDEYEHHVSYTVANSVLFDEKDNYFKNGGGIDLPPLPIGSFKAFDKKAAAPRLYNTFGATLSPTAKVPPPSMSINYLRTACAYPLPHREPNSLATVQSGCKNVMKDAIDQPMIASSLQNINFAPHMNMMNANQLLDTLPTVIQPLSDRSVADPQEVVALSIDRIIDVKERINDVKNSNGDVASAVEKEQLKVELSIANRQITTLDEQTKESCLLKELKAVDKQIENLSVGA